VSELADNAGVDVGTLVTDLANKGILGTIISKAISAGGDIQRRLSEGRSEAVNRELGLLAMQTDPAVIQRNASQIERARAAYDATTAARTRAVQTGAGAGAASGVAQGAATLGPADKIINGLLMGGR
jgi:hypothetical protein